MNRPRFSEQIILSVAKTTLTNARNNLTGLSEFGVNEDLLNQFEANIRTAEALPGETQKRIELKELTRDKDEALDACYAWGRKLQTRLELAFGKNSSQTKSFPTKEFGKAASSENTMMSVMEILLSLAEQHKTELANYGQTPEVLAQGSQCLDELRAADAAQELKKDTKLGATRERYQHFQTIYDTVNRINKVGRLVFASDPVRLALFESKWPAAASQAAEPETD